MERKGIWVGNFILHTKQSSDRNLSGGRFDEWAIFSFLSIIMVSIKAARVMHDIFQSSLHMQQLSLSAKFRLVFHKHSVVLELGGGRGEGGKILVFLANDPRKIFLTLYSITFPAGSCLDWIFIAFSFKFIFITFCYSQNVLYFINYLVTVQFSTFGTFIWIKKLNFSGTVNFQQLLCVFYLDLSYDKSSYLSL